MMTEYDQGFAEGLEMAAQAAEDFYTGIIRCKQTGNVEHVRMHVEYKWSAEVATRIRALKR